MKEATKQHKNNIADGHENKAKSPWKNLEGGQFTVFTKILNYFWLQSEQNKIRMHSLVLQERNN